MKFAEIRQKYPEYSDMSDEDFAQRFHKKFYSDMSFEQFSSKVGYAVKQPTEKEEGWSLDKALEGGKRLITEDIPNMLKDVVGANEAALNVGTGFTTGAAGGFIEGGQGIIDSVRDGTFGTKKGVRQSEEKFVKGMDNLTYAPRTERGKEIVKDVVDPVMHHLPSLVGAMPQLEALSAVRKVHKDAKRPLMEAFQKEPELSPAAQEVLKEREKLQTLHQKQEQAYREIEQQLKPVPHDNSTLRPEGELNLGQPNQFGQRPSQFVMDENGIPIDPRASLEAQTIARQGDLFEGGLPYESPLRMEEGGPSRRNGVDPTIGEVQEIAQRKLQEVDALRRGEQERAGTYPEQVPDNSINWQSPKQMEMDQLWEQKKAAEQAEQRAAKDTAWERAEAEQTPLDFEPTQRSMEMEKPGERTIYRPNSNKPLGQTGFGKGQRGSIGWFGKDKFKEFSEQLKREIPDITPEEIKSAWEKQQSKQQTQQVEKAVGKIAPTLEKSLSAYKDVPKEDALAAIKVSPDYDRPSLGTLTNVVQSRGRIGIEKIPHEGVKAGIAHIIGLRDAGKIKANEVLHGDNGIMKQMRKLEKWFGPGKADEIFRQRFEGQFDPNYKYNLDKDQLKVKEQMDALFDDIHTQMQEISGKKIPKIHNYFPSMFYGDFISAIRDADGRLVAYVTEKSARAAREATNHVLSEMGQGFTADLPKYRKEILSDKFKGRAGLGEHFEAMLDLMSSEDPVVQRAQQSVQNAIAKRAFDTRRMKDRFKHKAGILGNEGNKSWKKGNENYYAAKDVLENYVRAFEDWKANMETSKFLKEVQESAGDKKNTYNVLQQYFDDIRSQDRTISKTLRDIDNSMSNALGIGVGTKITNTGRSLANNLTKIWLGFWNPAAMAQNVLQPVHSIPKMVDMASYGGSKDIISPLIIGMTKSLVDSASIASNKFLGTELKGRAKYLKDFEVIKPGLIESSDRSKAGHFLEKNVVGGGLMTSEAFARATTFNIFETYLEHSGYSKQEAYSMAKNMTHEYMVNYESYAKPGWMSNTGVAGEMAGRLQSFKMNQFTQLANYIRTAKQTKNPAPALTALAISVGMAGMTGMIGMDVAEGIYGLLVKTGMVDPQTRSPRQWAMDQGGALAHGIPTQASGKWLSGSLTNNLVGDLSWRNLAPIFAGIGQAAEQIPTVAKWGRDLITGQDTLPDWEKAQAANTITPTVMRGVWENKFLTDPQGRVQSPFTGDVVYEKGPQDQDLLSRFTNIRSKERGETVARKALLQNQEKRIQDKVSSITDNITSIIEESARKGKQFDNQHVTNQFQRLLDLGHDPNQTVEALNKIIVQNNLGDWFTQQVATGQINFNNLNKKLRAMEEKEKIGK